MTRSKSSHQWLQEHFTDMYVKQAQQAGYRSRAAFKLIDMQQKYRFIRQGDCVLDIGAATGGWAQLLTQWVGKAGKVVAVDLLPMEPLEHVSFIQGDIMDEAVYEQVVAEIAPKTQVDVIVSDMAPNISGIVVADQARMMGLVEYVVEIAQSLLSPQGRLLIKVFQGSGFDTVLKQLQKTYGKVQILKPPASRQRSREMYFLVGASKKK
jgi:23S rRNA (uridine2552-2'-O)-methyltransferase